MKFEGFTAADICRILRTSKDLGLKALKLGPLEILFQGDLPKEVANDANVQPLTGQSEEPKEVPGAPIPETELQELISEIEQENFAIQDPAAYEKAILDERVFDRDYDGESSGRGTEARRS